MKIYISGPITNDPDFMQKFANAEAEIITAGYEPVNPARHELPEGATWVDYMRQDLKLLCDCDGVYMLENWQESKGAKIEHQLAQDLGLKIFYKLKI